jgi:hypothetical protein
MVVEDVCWLWWLVCKVGVFLSLLKRWREGKNELGERRANLNNRRYTTTALCWVACLCY